MDTNEFISAVYTIFLGREPDESGKNYWERKLKEGCSRDEFLSCLVSSSEFKNIRPVWFFDPIKCLPDGINVSDLILRGLKIGNNCTIHFDTILDPPHCNLIEIGDNVTFSPRCYVLAHDGSMRNILGLTKIGRVKIGDNVFVGAGSIILPNVCIGKNSIIGAGSVVTKDIPADSIAAGNPAKVIDSLESFIEKHKTLAKDSKAGDLVKGIAYLQ